MEETKKRDMSLHSTDYDLVRLHEKWMDTTDKRMCVVEKKISQIPWILFLVATNVCISLIAILLKQI